MLRLFRSAVEHLHSTEKKPSKPTHSHSIINTLDDRTSVQTINIKDPTISLLTAYSAYLSKVLREEQGMRIIRKFKLKIVNEAIHDLNTLDIQSRTTEKKIEILTSLLNKYEEYQTRFTCNGINQIEEHKEKLRASLINEAPKEYKNSLSPR